MPSGSKLQGLKARLVWLVLDLGLCVLSRRAAKWGSGSSFSGTGYETVSPALKVPPLESASGGHSFTITMETRNFQEARRYYITCYKPQYDNWAPNYEKDSALLEYQGHEHTVTVLMQYFTGDPSQTRVLDVACGSGLVAKKMAGLGFRQFVGVDASEGMLREAADMQLYQDLQLIILGKQPLSVEKGLFDVVTAVAAFYPGFIPVSAVRELCEATKPGGLVCIGRGNQSRPEYICYDAELEAEFTKMESEGLWTRLTETKFKRFIINVEKEEPDPEKRVYIPGTVYVFRKSS